MQHQVRERLLALNREFYAQFARPFATTRFAAQPGYERLLAYVPKEATVIDLGCGNGRLVRFLAARGRCGTYWGVDASLPLLAAAREATRHLPCWRVFLLALDLAEPGWAHVLPQAVFDVAFALAVLHHIPGQAYREAFVREMAALVRPGGYAILSTWRFLHNERMRRKIVPWEVVGLNERDVEPGDYLLDWKKEGIGYRYVHHVTEEEMARLAAQAGMDVVEMFHADGREGDLSLYTVLRKGK